MAGKESRPGPRRGISTRLVKPKEHDTYARRKKAANGFVCDQCKVVHHGGKWRWGVAPQADSRGGLCPACERIRDRYPAGTVRIPSSLIQNMDEIRDLVYSVEQSERAEHPLERVMGIEHSDEGMIITTTGIHMARCITGRLTRRFHKKPQLRYPPEQNLVFVDWPE